MGGMVARKPWSVTGFRARVRAILASWMVIHMCHVSADSLPVQKLPYHSCASISGRYYFKGKDDSTGELRTFFQVLWRKMAPTLWGDPTQFELVHNVSQNSMRIEMHGGDNLRQEPRSGGVFKLSCKGGMVNYDGGSHEGRSDGHRKKWHYSFLFVKDAKGALLAHAIYDTEDSILLFLSDKSRVEQSTIFSPASSESAPVSE